MKIPRLYTGDDGCSHWGEIEVEMEDAVGEATGGVARSRPQAARSISFRTAPADSFTGWHPAPRRQFVINLTGEVEYEVSDGSTRRFGPGDMYFCEDLTGPGHTSRGVGNAPRLSVYISLAD